MVHAYALYLNIRTRLTTYTISITLFQVFSFQKLPRVTLNDLGTLVATYYLNRTNESVRLSQDFSVSF